MLPAQHQQQSWTQLATILVKIAEHLAAKESDVVGLQNKQNMTEKACFVLVIVT